MTSYKCNMDKLWNFRHILNLLAILSVEDSVKLYIKLRDKHEHK